MIVKAQGTYILRIWFEPDTDGTYAWRANVTDTTTKEAHYFSEPEALGHFLSLIDMTIGDETLAGHLTEGLEPLS